MNYLLVIGLLFVLSLLVIVYAWERKAPFGVYFIGAVCSLWSFSILMQALTKLVLR